MYMMFSIDYSQCIRVVIRKKKKKKKKGEHAHKVISKVIRKVIIDFLKIIVPLSINFDVRLMLDV